MRFSQSDIIAVIPHRPPILLVDEIEEVEFKKRGVGLRAIRETDDFLETSSSGRSVMPRALLIEALAQTAAFVTAGGRLLPGADQGGYPTIGYLVRVADFVFSADVGVNDVMRLSVELSSSLGNIYKFAGVVRVGEVEVCRGSLTFSVS
jgi:3-hydroxyacyl-[acyl-carrier-protein] dehydratase